MNFFLSFLLWFRRINCLIFISLSLHSGVAPSSMLFPVVSSSLMVFKLSVFDLVTAVYVVMGLTDPLYNLGKASIPIFSLHHIVLFRRRAAFAALITFSITSSSKLSQLGNSMPSYPNFISCWITISCIYSLDLTGLFNVVMRFVLHTDITMLRDSDGRLNWCRNCKTLRFR